MAFLRGKGRIVCSEHVALFLYYYDLGITGATGYATHNGIPLRDSEYYKT